MSGQGALFLRDCTPKVEKHLTCGQSFIPRRPVFCTFGPSEPRKSHKYEDFPRFHEWPRTCNNSESSGHREGSARRIRLIPRVVSRTKFQWHKPLFWGRRIYVSFVRTIHGGSCCYCSYPAPRSLCCLSLGLNCCITCLLGSLTAPIFRVGKLRWRSGKAWPLSF